MVVVNPFQDVTDLYCEKVMGQYRNGSPHVAKVELH